MLVACLFGGAGAALADVLLSNIGSESKDTISFGTRFGSQDAAQAFTTGTSATGYTVSSIELKFIDARAAPTVTLHADSSGVGQKEADFNAPGTLTEAGINEFTPTARLTLTANTKYWIVVMGGRGTWEFFTDQGASTTSPVDGTPAAGWSVSSTAMSRSHSSTGAFSQYEEDAGWLLFRINGATAPPDIDTLTLSSPIPDQSAQAGTAFSYSFPRDTFIGPRGRTLTYFARESSGATLPYWLNFVPGTRTFWGTPRAQDVGTLSVKVTAGDGSLSVSDTFDIVVAPIPRTTAPLVSNLDQGWRVGMWGRGANPELRQRFTTGPNATSYTLSSVEVGRWDRPHSGSVTDDANTRLQVCPVAPTTGSCKNLTSPATTRHGADTMLFTASSGITLFPSATYDVVLTPAAGSTLWVGSTYIGDDDADSEVGWGIHQDASASNPRVRIAVFGTANGASAAPTSADKTVRTATDTPYVFSAADFPFTANTSGDTVASVVVATRTANDTSYDKGRLRLDGNDFETPFTLTKADLDAGRLVYTPWTDVRGGRRYARSPYEESFRFWVNGGTRATATHRMTIDVTGPFVCDRTPAVRDGILGAVSGVTDCRAVTEAHLREITLLTLPSNSLSTSGLRAGDFDGMAGLTRLDLNGTGLTSLPANIFDNLTALNHLYLYNNTLTTLPAGIFDHLTALTHLLLHTNALNALPDNIFEKLTALTGVGITQNPGTGAFLPVANAGESVTAAPAATVTLLGRATGPWGNNVAFLWEQVTDANGATVVTMNPVMLTDPNTATPSFTMPSNAVYFRLTVTGKGTGTTIFGVVPLPAASDTATVTVSTSSLATVAPSVTGAEIEPEANNGSWEEGETVEAALTFDEAVTVDTTGGTPTVALTLGASTAKTAAYVRGSGTAELVFGYTLAKDEGPYDSVLLTLNSLALNGGAIRSTASGADAALAHDGFAVIGGPTPRGVAEPGPTARFAALPQRHDGSTAFDIELHFSEAPAGLSYRARPRARLVRRRWRTSTCTTSLTSGSIANSGPKGLTVTPSSCAMPTMWSLGSSTGGTRNASCMRSESGSTSSIWPCIRTRPGSSSSDGTPRRTAERGGRAARRRSTFWASRTTAGRPGAGGSGSGASPLRSG